MPRLLSWRWVALSFLACLINQAGATEYVWQTNDIDYPSDEMRLEGDVKWAVDNKSLVSECAAECLKRDACRSFNFVKERRLCQLSNSTHADPGANLLSDPLSSYFTRDTFDVDMVGVYEVSLVSVNRAPSWSDDLVTYFPACFFLGHDCDL